VDALAAEMIKVERHEAKKPPGAENSAELEHFHKSCSAAFRTLWEAVFLVFGGVLAQ